MDPVIVSIVGSGRSGTTVMDIALGTLDRVCGVGELDRIFEYLAGSRNICACGERPDRCPFWSEVFGIARELDPEWDPATAHRLIDRWTMRYAHTPWLLPAVMPESEVRELRRQARVLYRAVGRVTGCGIVVDSSKRAAWAWVIGGDPSLDVRFVHLTRDGRGVVQSRKKELARDVSAGVEKPIPARSTPRAVLAWSNANLVAEWAIAVTGRPHVRVRYEDFVLDPAGGWEAICAGLALPAPTDDERGALAGPLVPEHQAAGGRVRQQAEIRLRPDQAWRKALPRRDELVYWGLAGIQALRYGYRPGR